MHVSVTDAKARLTDLVRRAEEGDEVILELAMVKRPFGLCQ